MRLYRILVVIIVSIFLLTFAACASPAQVEEEKSTQIQLQKMDENAGVVVWNDEEYDEQTEFYVPPTGPVQGLESPVDEIPQDIATMEMPTYISNLTLREFDIYRQTDNVWANVGRIEERGCAVMSVCTVLSGYDIDPMVINKMVYKYKSGGCAPVSMFLDCGIEAYWFTGIKEDELVRRMLNGEVFIIHEGPGRWTDSSHYMPLLDIRTNNGRYEVYVGNTIDYGKTGWVSLSSVLADMEDGYGIYTPFGNTTLH